MERRTGARGLAAAFAAVAAAVAACLALGVNALTAALVLVVAVLLVAARYGSWPGVAASLLATTAFNVAFLPPIGTLHLQDPENWIALACFLVSTVVASRLLSTARRRAEEADDRRRDVETLYRLSVELFTAATDRASIEDAVRRALRGIGAPEDAVAIVDGEQPAPPAPGTIPLLVAGRVHGSVVTSAGGPRAMLESIARLLALALEREALFEERARLAGLEASEAMKTAILRAVSHDLATPLAGMLLALEPLRRATSGDECGRDAADRLASDMTRLHRRIENLLAMARLEAGVTAPRREPTPPADLIRAARESLGALLGRRHVTVRVAPSCPDLDVDPSLALEILVNLVENAHRAAPEGAVEITAEAAGPSRVRIDVLDRGPGIAAAGTEDASPRPRGLGLIIARSLAAMLDGSVSLLARDGGGACARVELPAVAAP